MFSKEQRREVGSVLGAVLTARHQGCYIENVQDEELLGRLLHEVCGLLDHHERVRERLRVIADTI